jgi:hypothetical protein
VLNKVNIDLWRRARVRLAAWLAPAGVKVHDHREELCDCWEAMLEVVLFGWIRVDEYGEPFAPAAQMLNDLMVLGAVEREGDGRYSLSTWGMQQLARMWGPEIVPPWGGAWAGCADHGVFDAGPGESIYCPDCPKPIIETVRSRWSWKGHRKPAGHSR